MNNVLPPRTLAGSPPNSTPLSVSPVGLAHANPPPPPPLPLPPSKNSPCSQEEDEEAQVPREEASEEDQHHRLPAGRRPPRRRHHAAQRDDYKKYNGICCMAQKLMNIIKQMDPTDPFRIEMTDMLMDKPYNMGVIPTKKSLVICENLSASTFCRRRLATILVKLKFAEHLKEAVTFIEQGHVRVGPETITDPAFLVTRNMEDFITWVDTSRIKKNVMEYVGVLDDYDGMI